MGRDMSTPPRTPRRRRRGQRTWGQFAGQVVGAGMSGAATLSGNVEGAALGAMITEASQPMQVDQKESRSMVSTGVNVLAHKASMKRTGKGKLNISVKRNVQVSKQLRKKVKEVLKDSQANGEVITINRGYFSLQQQGADINANCTINGVNVFNESVIIAHVCPIQEFANQSSWFYAFQGRDLGNIATTNRFRDCMHYFRPFEILEAASMLWNGRLPSFSVGDLQPQTNNLFNMSNVAYTNVAATGIFANDNVKGLDIDIVDSHVVHKLKNLSNRTVRLTMFVVTSKRKQFLEGLGVIRESIFADCDRDANLLENAYTTGNGQINDFFLNGEFHPNMSKTFRSNYNCGTTEIIMKPNETCEHTIQGPKNTTLKFDKLNRVDAGFNVDTRMYAHTSVQVFYRLQVDETFATAGLLNGAGEAYASGGIVNCAKGNPIAEPVCPVSVTEKVVMKLKQPTQAGFIVTNAGVIAGQGVTLNQKFKQKKYIIVDRRVRQSRATLSYTNNDEENPLLINGIAADGTGANRFQ